MTIEKRIEQIICAIESYDYVVISSPINGLEQQYEENLKLGLDRIISTIATHEAIYKTRGRSKRAISNLHSYLPNPSWGIEIKIQ